MNDRIHAHLDGELPREALSPEELASLVALEASLAEVAAHVRAVPVPDLTARVMARLPEPQTRRSVLGWLWRPRSISFTYRPAYALGGFAVAALAVVLLVAPGERPAGAPPVAVASGGAPRLYVQFRLEAPSATDVRLAGSFTGWQPSLRLTEVAPGEWSTMVPLAPGVHDYTFVVDGKQWVPDPYAPQVEDSFGGRNSRLFLPAPAGSA